jgi:hypothetical protein
MLKVQQQVLKTQELCQNIRSARSQAENLVLNQETQKTKLSLIKEQPKEIESSERFKQLYNIKAKDNFKLLQPPQISTSKSSLEKYTCPSSPKLNAKKVIAQ